MAKKSKTTPNQPKTTSQVSSPSLVSKRGWKAIGGGIGLLIVGYGVLSLADSMGQNWASHLSPFLILGGYALIGFGIVLKDPIP